MRNFILTLVLLPGISAACAQQAQDRQLILTVLDRQTKAWNTGDVVAFMHGYWESDSLLYIGKTGVRQGYQTTLDSYRKNYPDRAAMGTLTFNILKVDILSADVAFVVGKWQLTRPVKGDVGGHFSLLWRKINGTWVIVADHSS